MDDIWLRRGNFVHLVHRFNISNTTVSQALGIYIFLISPPFPPFSFAFFAVHWGRKLWKNETRHQQNTAAEKAFIVFKLVWLKHSADQLRNCSAATLRCDGSDKCIPYKYSKINSQLCLLFFSFFFFQYLITCSCICLFSSFRFNSTMQTFFTGKGNKNVANGNATSGNELEDGNNCCVSVLDDPSFPLLGSGKAKQTGWATLSIQMAIRYLLRNS